MSEATLEVPAKYSAAIQNLFVGFRDDALGTVGHVALGLEHDLSDEYVEQERETARATEPLVQQGSTQWGKDVVTYVGSKTHIVRILEFRTNIVGDELAHWSGGGQSDFEKARELLDEMRWLVDVAEGLSVREAVAA